MQKSLLLLLLGFFCQQTIAQQNPEWRNFLYPVPNQIVPHGSKLWLASRGGLIEFDLRTEQRRIYQPDNCKMRGSNILSIVPQNDSTIWFSTTAGGLQKLNPITQTFTHYAVNDTGAVLGRFYDLQLDNKGRVWMMEDSWPEDNLACFDGRSWSTYLKDSLSWGYSKMRVDSTGNIWVLGDNDLFPTNSSNTQLIVFNPQNNTTKKIIEGDLGSNATLLVDKKNAVWVAWNNDTTSTTFNQDTMYLRKYENNTVQTFKTKVDWRGLQQITIDSLGQIVILNNQRVLTFSSGIWQKENTPLGTTLSLALTNNHGRWIIGSDVFSSEPNLLAKWQTGLIRPFKMIDSAHFSGIEDSDLWYGVNLHNNQPMTLPANFDGRVFKPNTLSPPDAFESDTTWSVKFFVDRNFQRLQVLGRTTQQTNRAIFRSSNGGDTILFPKKILVDDFKNKWVSILYDSKGIYRIDKNDRLTHFFFPDSLLTRNPSGYPINDFAVDKQGFVWVAGGYVLLKLDPNTGIWTNIKNPFGHSANYQQVTADDLGSIWLSSGYHYRITNNSWKWFNWQETYGLLSDWSLWTPKNPKWVVHRNGVWWLLNRYGLARYDGQTFKYFNSKNSPLPVAVALGLDMDRHGNLWIAHVLGLTVFNENGLRNVGIVPTKEVFQLENFTSTIIPNPLIINGLLQFDNPHSETFVVKIVDINGRLWLSGKTSSDRFLIEKNKLPSGFYIYSVSNEKRVSSGKFVVD